MGGHGGLNILPQKRWNVYNYDNREKVRSDESAAAREEQIQREASRRRDADLRLAALRRNRGLQAAASPPPPPIAQPEEAPASDGDHINLFSGADADFAALASSDGGRGAARDRNSVNPNPNPKKRKKEEEVRTVGPDEEKYRLGYGVAGKGVAAPWYVATPSAASSSAGKERRDWEREQGSGGRKRSKGVKSIEEMREERRRREAKEKERECAVLAAAAKERSLERGRSSRWAR